MHTAKIGTGGTALDINTSATNGGLINTSPRKRGAFYFLANAEPWLRPDMTVLEVGPRRGKWTVQIAAKAKRVIVLDVAEEMLNRTKARCESSKVSNVDYILANGKNFQPIVDESIDFFFSYDVFVHIALADTWPYSQEMSRVLKAGGMGACHYAITPFLMPGSN